MTPEALEMVYATAIARSYNIAVTCLFFFQKQMDMSVDRSVETDNVNDS